LQELQRQWQRLRFFSTVELVNSLKLEKAQAKVMVDQAARIKRLAAGSVIAAPVGSAKISAIKPEGICLQLDP
jgi:predicted NUDIX family NTP pyrophosphohydrolase